MKKKLQLAIVAASFAVAMNTSAAISFVNGGFETGDLTGWGGTATTDPYGYNPFGTTYGSGMEGTHWMWLAGYELDRTLNQTITGLTMGNTYNVNFIMASEYVNPDSLRVTADGVGAAIFTAPPKAVSFWDTWVAKTYTFTATSTSALIEFNSVGLNKGGYDVGLDNISISDAAVPEPSTYIAGALMLLPFGLQGIRHLRSRKQAA